MSLENLGIHPFEQDVPTHIELLASAKLYTLESKSLPAEQRLALQSIGLDFLDSLSDTSFHMRFGTTKPDTRRLSRLVDHFLDGQIHPHTMLLLMHDQQLLGATSLFRHILRSSPGSEALDTSHVIELSVTVLDELQGQGLGKLLLSHARQYAIDSGYTHAYFGFEPTNEASRHMVERVCGAEQLVAGVTNPRDKYYRLVSFTPELEDIEQTMRSYCDAETSQPNEADNHPHKYPRFTRSKLGRKILDTLESIDITLPNGFQLNREALGRSDQLRN